MIGLPRHKLIADPQALDIRAVRIDPKPCSILRQIGAAAVSGLVRCRGRLITDARRAGGGRALD